MLKGSVRLHRFIIGTIIGLLVIGFWGCSVVSNDLTKPYLDQSKVSERLIITDDYADQGLKEQYGINHLMDHGAYHIGDELCYYFVLDEEATREEVSTLQSIYMNVVIRWGLPIGYSPYYAPLELMESTQRYTLRLFMGEDLLYYKTYYKADNRFVAFENTSIDVPFRVSNTDGLEKALTQLTLKFPHLQIKEMDPVISYVRLLKITHWSSSLSIEEKEAYKTDISHYVKVHNQVKTSKSKPFYVLEIKSSRGEIMDTLTYDVQADTWIDVDWMNEDFYSRGGK